MANEPEAPVYAYTAVTEEDAKGVFLTFAGMTAADFLDQARASIARVDTKVAEQKDEISRQTVELQAKDETIAAREREISSLHGTITSKNGKIDGLIDAWRLTNETLAAAEAKVVELGSQVKELTEKLALVKMAGKSMPKGLERLEGGGLRLPVTLDVDEATPLLSWAADAGEDPAEYVAKIIKDALVSVVSS